MFQCLRGFKKSVNFSNDHTNKISFIAQVIGGYQNNGPIDSVYEFDPLEESWIERTEKLAQRRFYSAAIPLPDDPNVCN